MIYTYKYIIQEKLVPIFYIIYIYIYTYDIYIKNVTRMLRGRPHIYTYARRTRARRNPDYVTKIRLLNKDFITKQRSDYVTKIRLLKKDSTTKQRSDY